MHLLQESQHDLKYTPHVLCSEYHPSEGQQIVLLLNFTYECISFLKLTASMNKITLESYNICRIRSLV